MFKKHISEERAMNFPVRLPFFLCFSCFGSRDIWILFNCIVSRYNVAFQVCFYRDASTFCLRSSLLTFSLLPVPSRREVALLPCVVRIVLSCMAGHIQVPTSGLISDRLNQNLRRWTPDTGILKEFRVILMGSQGQRTVEERSRKTCD